MPSRLFILAILFSLPFRVVAQDSHLLTGNVVDAVTGEQLASANIRLLGSSQGTIANVAGKFLFHLPAGRHAILVSMLGYRSDTLMVDLSADRTITVRLSPAEITLAEIVVTAEDPAIAIMRKVVANKHLWSEKLISYEFEAFNRQVIRRDTSIAGITETFTKGIWQVGDTLREVITHKRQTENVSAAQNFASVGRILNFYEDDIRFLGYTFVGPTSHDAFDYYTFRLLRTSKAGGREMHVIALIPKSRTSPLFAGTISVAGDSYALAGVDVEPNEAFQLPFVKEKSLRYQQQFGLYDSTFWMPVDIRIEGSFKVGIIGLEIPKIGLQQTSVITKYTINPVIPDSLLHMPRLRTDSLAARPDSAYWARNTVLPLNPTEQRAYAKLDSTQTMEKQFQPKGAFGALNDMSGETDSFLSIIDLSYNRVEGLHVGGHKTFDSLVTHTSLSGGAAYGFSNKFWSYRFGATIFTDRKRGIGIGVETYRVMDHDEGWGYYAPLTNSLSTLFDKEDYNDYFAAHGWRGFVTVDAVKNLRMKASFIKERHFGSLQISDFSFFSRSRSFRPNPAIDEGELRSVRFDLRWGAPEIPLGIITQDSFTMRVEHSSPRIFGSDFNFTRYEGAVEYSFATWGRDFLLKPTLRTRIAAGGAAGTLPVQRTYWLESQLASYAPFGVMKTLPVKDMGGAGYWSIQVEQNFRSLPFLALDIPFLYENNIEVLVHGGAARVWRGTSRSDEPVYYEAGFGFSRILEVIRTDFTWRLSGSGGFRFTLGLATLF